MAFGESAALLFKIKGDPSDAVNAFQQVKREGKDLASDLGKTGAGAGSLSGAFTSLAGPAALAAAGVAAIGAAAIAGGLALFNLTKTAAAFGSEIFDASEKTGATAETLSSLKFAAEQSGTSFDKVSGSIVKFNILLAESKDGNEKAAATLKKYGITATDVDGALAQALKTVAEITDVDKQAAAAKALFKDKTAELLPFIKSFDGDLTKLIKTTKELGVTISNEAMIAADEFEDQMDTLGAQLAGVGRVIGMELMPVFLEMARDISGWLKENKGQVSSWARAFADQINIAVAAVKQLILYNEILANTVDINMSTEDVGKRRIQIDAELAHLERVRTGVKYETLEDGRRIGGEGRDKSSIRFTPKADKDSDSSSGSGKRAAKVAGDSFEKQFREYAKDVDFEVQRVKGGAINKRSLHPSGQAGDLRIGGKSEKEIVAALAEGITRGFRVLDERWVGALKGVKSTGPNIHAERVGSKKASMFVDGRPDIYGGQENLDYLKKLDADRLAKKTPGATGVEKNQKDIEVNKQKAAEKELDDLENQFQALMRMERDASSERLAIRAKEADLEFEIIKGQVQRGEITEEQALERVRQLKVDMLMEERKELAGQISTRENIHKIKLLDLDIEKQILENVREKAEIESKEREAKAEAWKKRIEQKEQEDAWRDEEQQRKAMEALESAEGGDGTFRGGLGQGMGVQTPSIFGKDGEGKNVILQEAEFLKKVYGDIASSAGRATGAMVQGLAGLVTQWLITGKFSAKAALQMAAGIAIGLAMESGMKAIMEVAHGLAAAARYDYKSATLHFAAAKTYAVVAAVAGGVGVGLGLAGRAAGGGGSGRGGSQAFAGQTGQENNRNVAGQGGNYSSQQDTIIEQGRNSPFDRQQNRIEVIFRDRSGWFAEMFETEVKKGGKVREVIRDTAGDS